MTACAIETAAKEEAVASTGFTITADGTYAARLAGTRDALFPERWTLDGPEPYAVPLPLDQPEERDAEVLPLADGRVLINRRAGERHTFSLLYPTGPGTGELALGAVEAAELTLLPPAPDGAYAYALAPGETSTAVWLVAGGAFGPERVADVPGRCSGGAWLDRTGRLLALDRQQPGGPVKTVAVDLALGGVVTPLLEITDESDDRLLLADADSGLLLIRSNAPGEGRDRLGWGVLGSLRPVRFPESLRLPDALVTPFAVQPGQILAPESCAVALRIDGAAGSWLGVWRPAGRRLHQLAPPPGWLAGSGTWSRDGVLRLPYATGEVPCGVVRMEAPEDGAGGGEAGGAAGGAETFGLPDANGVRSPGEGPATEPAQAEHAGGEPCEASGSPAVCKPVPLQQAPLTGRAARG
ncbi:hypothetical protein HW130_15175 [Streptomyces sp. PKU-EA00015]|uniref:hypothetical protein n=1 Tax=Streptomyces sp. PKU-EA00015 TaxID=2748326 RepID=UPI00159FB6D8|nr:hypothetical protein [Streptomyces sp. PKU-EA00015]NWF27589.1 hypothetical protein [Streptomyces sp. PKU-EA00015]